MLHRAVDGAHPRVVFIERRGVCGVDGGDAQDRKGRGVTPSAARCRCTLAQGCNSRTVAQLGFGTDEDVQVVQRAAGAEGVFDVPPVAVGARHATAADVPEADADAGGGVGAGSGAVGGGGLRIRGTARRIAGLFGRRGAALVGGKH